MNLTTKLTNALIAGAFAATTGILSAAPAAAQSVPSYSRPSSDETIHGRIASIEGPYRISVRDDRGFIDSVTLHPGTIINPTGFTLAPGLAVTIIGHNDGNALAANEIDTAYHQFAALPVYPLYGYYGSPYPYRGYGYGPSYRLGLRFGRGFGFGLRG